MKVMTDTTVFLAECLLTSQKYPKLFRRIVSDHRLVFPTAQIEEIREIMEKFFPQEGDTVELFLSRFSYETVESGERPEEGYPFLPDAKRAGVSCIITLDPELAGTSEDGIAFTDPDSFMNGNADE